MIRIVLFLFIIVAIILAAPANARETATSYPLTVKDLGDKVRIESDGALVTEYRYKDVMVPFFHPIIGPTGVNMTRNWPMSKEDPKESHDHEHHTGLWFTHGKVNGVDYWTKSPKRGQIVQTKIVSTEDGPVGRFTTENEWKPTTTATAILSDVRAYEIRKDSNGVTIDCDIKLSAFDEPVTFGDTKEGSFAIRLPDSMKVKDGPGHIVTSAGEKDAKAWGTKAEWVDYYGPVADKTVGVAIFDHPQNPRHPTWWQVRDYGLFAANPFGQSDFEKKEKGIGDLKIEPRESLRFRYRVVLHEGDADQAGIAGRYKNYAAQSGAAK